MDLNSMNLAGMPEKEMQDLAPVGSAEYELSQRFAELYCTRPDFSSFQICIMLGYKANVASEWASYYTTDTLTLLLIEQFKKTQCSINTKEEKRAILNDEVDRVLLKHMRSSDPLVSLAAVKEIIKKNGFDKPEIEDKDDEVLGGVMIVGQCSSVDDWEKTALESQSILKQEARK